MVELYHGVWFNELNVGKLARLKSGIWLSDFVNYITVTGSNSRKRNQTKEVLIFSFGCFNFSFIFRFYFCHIVAIMWILQIANHGWSKIPSWSCNFGVDCCNIRHYEDEKHSKTLQNTRSKSLPITFTFAAGGDDAKIEIQASHKSLTKQCNIHTWVKPSRFIFYEDDECWWRW